MRAAILLLDDEPMVTAALSALLAMEEYTVVAFHQPSEALAHLQSHAVDLIVSDQMMPGMTGLEFFGQVKRIQPEAVRILLTGFGNQSDAIRALNETGLFLYLEKPWQNDQLLLAVHNGLERKRLFTELQETIGQLRIAGGQVERLKSGLVELYLQKDGEGAVRAREDLRGIVSGEVRTGTRRLMAALFGVSALLIASISYIAFLSFFTLRQEDARLRMQIGEIRGRQVQMAEVERMRAHAPAAQPPGEGAERIAAEYEASVCFIQGAYVFEDKETSRMLRLVTVGASPSVDSSGNAEWTLEGTGPAVEYFYSGTGFHAGGGRILTNRHVAEPWWADPQAQKIVSAGFRPKHRIFVAYFPGRREPVALRTGKISTHADLAVLDAAPAAGLPKAAPLADRGREVSAGAPVLLIGYPAGLEALLARISQAELNRIPNFLNLDQDGVAAELARRGMIRPFVAQGAVSTVSKDVIGYDALTGSGGSGGPLFNREGRVIAIHFSSLTQFAGASLGVPVRFAAELL